MLPAALAAIYIVWGSTYLAIRVMVETMPPLLSAGVRFGLAALIIGSVPLWVVLFRTAYGDKVPAMTLGGVAFGFVGLAILVLPGDRPGDAPLWGVLLILFAALSWAAGSYYAKRTPLPEDALVSTGWQMMLGGAGMVVVGAIAGEAGDVDVGAFSTDSLLAFLYLIVFGSWLAFTAYAWLLQNAPVSTVATYAYVNPVIAIFLGWAILSEEITATVVAGAAAIVLSVATVVRRESEPAAAPEPQAPAPARP